MGTLKTYLCRYLILLFTVTISGQKIDTTSGQPILSAGVKHVIGKITEVDYTQSPKIFIDVLNDSTQTTTRILTPKYIRGQKEFYILKDSVNVMPPPLHITNFWVTENKMYIETSEPVTLRLFNRNFGWYGSGVPWGMQDLNHEDGYMMGQAFSFDKRWFTTETNNDVRAPSPDDWDFALELHPIRIGIPLWSHWMHWRTFYFMMYEHEGVALFTTNGSYEDPITGSVRTEPIPRTVGPYPLSE